MEIPKLDQAIDLVKKSKGTIAAHSATSSGSILVTIFIVLKLIGPSVTAAEQKADSAIAKAAKSEGTVEQISGQMSDIQAMLRALVTKENLVIVDTVRQVDTVVVRDSTVPDSTQ